MLTVYAILEGAGKMLTKGLCLNATNAPRPANHSDKSCSVENRANSPACRLCLSATPCVFRPEDRRSVLSAKPVKARAPRDLLPGAVRCPPIGAKPAQRQTPTQPHWSPKARHADPARQNRQDSSFDVCNVWVQKSSAGNGNPGSEPKSAANSAPNSAPNSAGENEKLR